MTTTAIRSTNANDGRVGQAHRHGAAATQGAPPGCAGEDRATLRPCDTPCAGAYPGSPLPPKAWAEVASWAKRIAWPGVATFLGAWMLLLAWPTSSAHAARRIPVHIESSPYGAAVYVDSTETPPIGTTPLKNVRIERGTHVLIFKKEGFEEARLNISVRRYRETFRVTLTPVAKLSINPGNADSQGAKLSVDGQPVGELPYNGVIKPGRHYLKITKEGFQEFEQWVDIAGGQILSLPVFLQVSAPKGGSVLITASVTGSVAFLDGAPQGPVPAVIENVSPGAHVVEVQAPGRPPFQSTVTVTAGQRAVVSADLGASSAGKGKLRVITNVPAEIFVDGERAGKAPLNLESLEVGQHQIEARAEGYDIADEIVDVVEGQRKLISLRLQQGVAKPGTITVNSQTENATVKIDGEDRGSPPVVINNAAPGTHAVEISAPGHRAYATSCVIGTGKGCNVDVELQAGQVTLRVGSNIPGATLSVDGENKGPVPWEGPVFAGSRRIEVSAEGYRSHSEQIMLTEVGERREITVEMLPEGEMTEEEYMLARKREEKAKERAFSYAAAPLPVGIPTLDLSIGWPYIAEARLGVGILSFLEGGFAVRTFGRLTDFEGRVKAGWTFRELLSLGVQTRFGGGIGPKRSAVDREGPDASSHPTNSGFVIVEALGTLRFARAAAFTLFLGADFITDRWDWEGDDKDEWVGRNSRQRMSRFRVGGVIEVAMHRHWNFFTLLEGVVAESSDGRRVVGDIFNAGNDDIRIYFRTGVSYKF